MKAILAVAAGGMIGALARYGVASVVAHLWRKPFPLATFLINVVGSLLIGVSFALFERRADLDPAWRVFVATGVLGAFTTFSTFELETHQLHQSGATITSIVYVIASVACGYLALQAGLGMGRR